MNTKRLSLVVLALVIVCQQAGIGQDKPTVPAEGTAAEAELDPQLKVFKGALLDNGSIDAASVLLYHEDPNAREILLDVLRQSENRQARMAVCQSLIKAKADRKTVKDVQSFIEPLLGVLHSETDAEAQLAAEATLIFEYEKIAESLGKIVADAAKPLKARLNAIYALKLQPDKNAAIKLIELRGDREPQIAVAAEEALKSLGIQKETMDQLKKQSTEAFLRNRLMRQEEQVREIRAESNLWQAAYLDALGEIYDSKTDDAAKGEFLAEKLANPKAEVRLWALRKAYEWRVAQGSKLPDKLGPVLINLISDSNKDVRLRTAELLALMEELNSAPRLLGQLEVEQDDQVRIKLFVALGGACSYAISPGSTVKISPEQIKDMRKRTLKWAKDFLFEDDAEKAQNGAKVIRKLLERDGLEPNDVNDYLGCLSKRYNPQENKPDRALKGELLSAMAGLCAQNSTCKAKADKLFEPLFVEALQDKTDFVREAAVDGLANIGKASALERLRKDFVNDPSILVRKKLIALAGEVCDEDDLDWLAEKIGSNSESDPAWQAMLKTFKVVFKDPDPGVLEVLNKWVEKLTSQSSKLSNEQKIAFLTTAEKRADTESRPKIRRKLLEVYLTWPKPDLAANLVANALQKEDLDPSNVLLQTIHDYLGKPTPGTDPNAVLGALSAIKHPQGRPKWESWLKAQRSKYKKPDKPKQPDT